jgi:hypothetical protein
MIACTTSIGCYNHTENFNTVQEGIFFVNFFSRSFLFFAASGGKERKHSRFLLIDLLSVQGNNSASDSSRPPGALQTSLQ